MANNKLFKHLFLCRYKQTTEGKMPGPKKNETIEQWAERIMRPLNDEIAKTRQIAKDLMNWNLKLNFVEGLRSSKGGNNV